MINKIENPNNDNLGEKTFVVVFATEDNQTLTISRNSSDIHSITLNTGERSNIKKLPTDTVTIENAIVEATDSIGAFTQLRRVEDRFIRADLIS